MSQPFWKRKKLHEMTPEEWESLCDGCARCCTVKIEDEDTGEVAQTAVSCRLLDVHTCRCTNYAQRTELVPGCVVMTQEYARDLPWLPETCAYRLIARGQDLYDWHPLVSGDPESVHRAGISVQEKVVSEELVDDDALYLFIVEEL